MPVMPYLSSVSCAFSTISEAPMVSFANVLPSVQFLKWSRYSIFPSRPLDRGEFQVQCLKTDAARKGGDHLNDLKMDGFFADNALLSDLLTTLPQTPGLIQT